MQNLSLPKSLRTIDEYVYYQWSNLENIDIADGNKQFLFEDGILYSKDKTVLYRMLPKHASEHFSVPEGVLHIGPWAFYGCQLQSMDLPESLLSIGKDAFTNTGISGLFIPQNVVHIEGALWTYWQTEVTIAPENPHLMSVDGVIFDSAGKTLLYYPNAREAKHYEIPAGVERIGDSAFTMVESLETLTFPAGLKEIGETAFFSCNNLTEVYLPEGVKQIGRQAFDYCEKLTVLVIPASATEIYSYLCENSPGVTIYGVPGSEAERVAEECKRPFADIATLDLPETHKPQETPAPEEPDASETEQEVKSLSIQEGSGPLMLREAPDKDAEIVLKIGKGAIVQLLGEPDENNWVQLTCDGVSGYAHAKYIQTYDWTETYTWKAYLDIVHNALKASGQETVVIPSPAFVEGYQVESHALVVPEGKALVIQGGQFESMSLGSGNITLAGVTVIAKDEEQSAIYLPAMRSSAELNLIIGQDTRVVATGTRGHGIGSEFIRQQSTGIALVNHGTIASEQSIAVDLQMSVSGKNQISVQVYNDGIMEGALFGPVRVNVFTQNGPIDVEIINAGQLLTSGDWGLDISLNTEKATPTARVENQQNALIQSLGWAVSMEMQVEKGDETLGEGTLINRGEIVAGGPETIAPTDDDCAVRFSTGTHLPVPIRLINEGTLKNRGIAPLFDLWLEQSYSNERDLLTQEEVTAIALPWLQQMGFGEYPEGTEAEILLFAGSNIWNTDIKYRYTVENSGL